MWPLSPPVWSRLCETHQVAWPGVVWITGTELPLEKLLSLLLNLIWSPLLWSVTIVLYEPGHPLMAFLNACGFFVTSQHWSQFLWQNEQGCLCLTNFPHLPTWENCHTFHKTAFLSSPFFSWCMTRPMKQLLTPRRGLFCLLSSPCQLDYVIGRPAALLFKFCSSPPDPNSGWNLDGWRLALF